MKHMILLTKFVLGIISLLLLVACTTLLKPNVKTELIELRAGQYQLDPKHSSLIFRVNHLGLSDYVGRFNGFDASLDFDPQTPLEMKLDAAIDMTSVDVNDQDFEETLASSSWLDTKRFPQAFFKSILVTRISDGQFMIKGQLTLKSITKPIDLKVTFNGGANNLLTGKYTLGFKASTNFKRSDFGVDAYLGLVGDKISIEVDGEFLTR